MPWGKTSKFDRYTVTPSKAWGDQAYDAPASEDIDVMGPQGADSLIGLGQTTVPAPVAAPPAPAPAPASKPLTSYLTWGNLAVAAVLGGLVALGWDAYNAPPEAGSGRRWN
jgi:hypothetical protein